MVGQGADRQWPNGRMAKKHMTKRTYGRKTHDRKYISPKGRMTENHGEMDI